MTGHDFLHLAQVLASGATEAEWRSAVSRAYYAGFHVARDLLWDMGFKVPRADAAHKYLAFRLQNCGHGPLEQVGRDLDALRTDRNHADYDFVPAFTKGRATSLVTSSRGLVQALALATVEPTRTQVRDGIIAYERNVVHQVTWSTPPP
jgi:uncharacterized protein (UPF0332 family)